MLMQQLTQGTVQDLNSPTTKQMTNNATLSGEEKERKV